MKPIPINIAVEDLLSEGVAKRLLNHVNRMYEIGAIFNRGGNGYLKKTAPGWNAAARGIPFFLLTDLDAEACPGQLLNDWMPGGIHTNMIARVAVTEVEAWLLADKQAFSEFLSVPTKRLPDDPESVADPKALLVKLAARSPNRVLRQRLVPVLNSTAKQGRDYNSCLLEFVLNHWNPDEAAGRSESLHRCLARLGHFEPEW